MFSHTVHLLDVKGMKYTHLSTNCCVLVVQDRVHETRDG